IRLNINSMIKKLPKILIIFFLIIFILQLFSLVFLVFYPRASQAAELGQNCQNDSDCVENLECRDNLCTMVVTPQDDDIKFKPQVDIPGYIVVQPDGSTAAIGEYIKAIYKYAVGVVGILAAVVLMFGGVLWLTAGGNPERIGNAKSWISASLTGLILAFLSYAILATINPALVNFTIIGVDEPGERITGCCPELKTTGKCNAYVKEDECKSGWIEGNSYTCEDDKCVKAETGCCLYDYGILGILAGYRSCKAYITLYSCNKLPSSIKSPSWINNLECQTSKLTGLWGCVK
ncbi:MAG: pilin, partial [Patescibacteria group bacterium]